MTIYIMGMLITLIEVFGSICFFDTFMESKKPLKYRIPGTFFLMMSGALVGRGVSFLKAFLIIGGTVLFCIYCYEASWKKCLFLGLINYGIICACDFALLLIAPEILRAFDGQAVEYLLIFLEKFLWLGVLYLFRGFYKKGKGKQEPSNGIWLKFSVVPLFMLVALLGMVIKYYADGTTSVFYFFSMAGMVAASFILIYLVQDMLESSQQKQMEETKSRAVKNQLEAYRDMQELYDRQRRKMHDYKNQLATVQTLLQGKDVDAALKYLEQLTGSIAVDMSAVNTNHPVVNAVLNQKIHTARRKNIPIILKISDLHELELTEEEIVILLSNLLDNALAACERVMEHGGSPVIHLKLVCEDGMLICSIKNPVTEQVKIVDNMVADATEENHGLGLLNVKEVVEKHQGEMVLTCADREFQVIVMI